MCPLRRSKARRVKTDMAIERGISGCPIESPRPPIPPEKEILRILQRKLWAKKEFRKLTKGRGFMQKKIDGQLILENGAVLTIHYSREKFDEELRVNWSRMSPVKSISFDQDAFIASSLLPELSRSSFISSYHDVKNGTKFPGRGGVGGFIELSKSETLKEIRSFAVYYL